MGRNEWIRCFREIHKEDVAEAGGKGANLGEMTAAGFPVPDGFVICAEAYRHYLRANGMDAEAKELFEQAEETQDLLAAAAEMREGILKGRMPEDLAEAIKEAFAKSGIRRAAVRSSATAEDLPDASFAGQQETYLNVTGTEGILEKTKECYASLWGERAVVYRQKQGYDQTGTALAVVIQEMAESEKAGVMFTVNPVTGDRDEIQINASWGLGESVVSGRVTPDSFLCGRDGRIKKVTIGTKCTEIVSAAGEDGASGTVGRSVPEDRRKTQTLTAEEAAELCRAGIQAEEHYGMPLDIEWAIAEGKVYILQARAVTTLEKEGEIPEEVWRKYYIPGKSTGSLKKNLSFLLEKMNDVFLPFDYDIGRTINMQKSVIFAEAGLTVDMHPAIDENGIMNLPPNTIGITRRIFRLGKVLGEAKDWERSVQVLEEDMKAFGREVRDLAEIDADALTFREAVREILAGEDLIRRIMYCRFKYALFPQILMDRKMNRCVKKADPSRDNYDLLQDLNNRTAEVTRDLEKLAGVIRKDPALSEDAGRGMGAQALSERHAAFREAFSEFMEKNGFKTDKNCYCLASRSYREDPDRVLQIIRPMLKRETAGQTENVYAPLLEKIRSVFGDAKFRKIRREIEAYRYFHVVREESQYLWETVFYYMKKFHARASALAFGDPDYSEGTAWLFMKELREAGETGTVSDALRARIEKRKELHPVAVRVWEESKRSIFSGEGEVLKGTGCSAGLAEGRVCTVSGPEEFFKLQKGDILVCRLTDPEWTPLFTLAAGVVADTGAELSHASIVAREYGIPAVLGVGTATSVLKDGDLVRVDGTRGEVSRVK